MSRSPLAYPLHRGVDADGGGAAELQTDIMRFMAILALCLVAIFALVQSIPLAPPEPSAAPERAQNPVAAAQLPATSETEPAPEPVPLELPVETPAEQAPVDRAVQLTRPEWQPKFGRLDAPVETIPAATAPAAEPAPSPATNAAEGFTLRFESDAALLRAVAAGKVGFYAISAGRARRMAVSNSRISFWDASTPNSFHEMESGTVPAAVVDALGSAGDTTRWGVTMPGRMTAELKTLMASNTAGILVIAADGHIRLEAQ